MCGLDVPSSQVSKTAALQDDEQEDCRNRPLEEHADLVLVERFEKARYGGEVRSVTVLCAIGAKAASTLSVIGMSTK